MPHSGHNEYISVDDALHRILKAVHTVTKTERVPAKNAINRVLGDNHSAQRDIPATDNSAMDGYLFWTNDLDEGKRTFLISGEIRPEDDAPTHPESGTCSEIMTGATVPKGDFTIVPVEMVETQGDSVIVNEIPDRNPIRKRGEGYRKGKHVLDQNTVIRPYEAGLLIESGNLECDVLKTIRVGIQVTGSEISEDRNSNGPVLNGIINEWPGTEVKEWPVLEDDPESVKDRMLALKDASDVVLTTGGISMGKHDYILDVMHELGAEIVVRKVKQKPGKPLTVSILDDTLFFHLPGNPISALFTAEYYARAVVWKMLGLKYEPRTVVAGTRLKNHRPDKTLFVPGKFKIDADHRLIVESEGTMKSHLMQLYRDSDVYVRINPNTTIEPGEAVQVTPYSTTRLP